MHPYIESYCQYTPLPSSEVVHIRPTLVYLNAEISSLPSNVQYEIKHRTVNCTIHSCNTLGTIYSNNTRTQEQLDTAKATFNLNAFRMNNIYYNHEHDYFSQLHVLLVVSCTYYCILYIFNKI